MRTPILLAAALIIACVTILPLLGENMAIYYAAALSLIVVVNWFAASYGPPLVMRTALLLTGAMPMLYWAAVNVQFFLRDGSATFDEPYFVVFLIMAVGASAITFVAAFLGRALAMPRKKSVT